MGHPAGLRLIRGAARPLGAAVLALILSSSVSTPPAWGAAPLPVQQAYVQGDSVMVGALGEVDSVLHADGWKGTFTGFIGLHTWASIGLFRQVPATPASVVVVELGANDCCDAGSFATEIDRVMRSVNGRHVIWLTVPTFKPGVDGLDAAIRAAAARWPNLQVADWGAYVATTAGTTWPGDQVHLTPAGAGRFAVFLRDELDFWYAPFGGPGRLHTLGRAAPQLDGGGQPASGGAIGGAVADGGGYWVVDTRGGVYSFGDAAFYGSAGEVPLAAPVVGMAATPDGRGYWLVGSDGGVFSFGDAVFYGSLRGRALTDPVVGMAATPDGRGYWLVSADGAVHRFGDAAFCGSRTGRAQADPVVGMAPTPDGRGYWLAGAGGTVRAFGDAHDFGSMSGRTLSGDIQAITATSDGRGYWLVGSDGGVFSFGDAAFYGNGAAPAPAAGGSAAAGGPAAWYSDLLARPGGGYWLVGAVPQLGSPAIGQPAWARPAEPPGGRRASARREAHSSARRRGVGDATDGRAVRHHRSGGWGDAALVLLGMIGAVLGLSLMTPRARANRARRRRRQRLVEARNNG